MKTYRQVISDILNSLNITNLDDRMSFRFLYSLLVGRLETITRQDSLDRTFLSINNIWYPLKKLEMEDYSESSCGVYYENTDNLKVSVNKIPDVFSGKNGSFIKILNINNSIEYKQTKSFLYKDIKNREYSSKKFKYFWIENNYLFIPDSNVEVVKALGLFKNSKEVDFLNNECDKCFKILDSLILVPDYIIDIAKKDIINELRNITKTIIKDEDPDLNQNKK